MRINSVAQSPQPPRARPGEVLLDPIGAAGYGAYLKLDPRAS